MNKSIKLNNKGLSLIELLVALAISSIILTAVALLMSNGVFGYNKQTTMSSLQDEANLAMNHINNAIMEANYIELVQADDGSNTLSFITHNDTSSVNGIASNKYLFNPDDNTLYVADIDGDLASASPLCINVKSFMVQFLKGSINDDGSGAPAVVSIANSVQVKVTIELEHNEQNRLINRITNVRNKFTLNTLKMPALTTDGNIAGVEISRLRSLNYIAD